MNKKGNKKMIVRVDYCMPFEKLVEKVGKKRGWKEFDECSYICLFEHPTHGLCHINDKGEVYNEDDYDCIKDKGTILEKIDFKKEMNWANMMLATRPSDEDYVMVIFEPIKNDKEESLLMDENTSEECEIETDYIDVD